MHFHALQLNLMHFMCEIYKSYFPRRKGGEIFNGIQLKNRTNSEKWKNL